MRLDKKFLARLLGVAENLIGDIKGLTFELNVDGGLQTFKEVLDERHKKKAMELATALTKEDDLGTVVRAHIHIEHELHDFIFFAAPARDHLKSTDKMEFSEKVTLALVLGLKSNLKPSLNAAGNLRNDFAHKLDMNLGEDRLKNLIATLSPDSKQGYQRLLKEYLAMAEGAQNLSSEAKAFYLRRAQLSSFFLQLFMDVANERHRLAFEMLQSIALH
jgi:hypothetical protein